MNDLAICDLTSEDATLVYERRLERLRRIEGRHGVEVNAIGARLLNRCIFESGAMLRDMKRSAAHSPS